MIPIDLHRIITLLKFLKVSDTNVRFISNNPNGTQCLIYAGTPLTWKETFYLLIGV